MRNFREKTYKSKFQTVENRVERKENKNQRMEETGESQSKKSVIITFLDIEPISKISEEKLSARTERRELNVKA